jgi:hypothetical protein
MCYIVKNFFRVPLVIIVWLFTHGRLRPCLLQCSQVDTINLKREFRLMHIFCAFLLIFVQILLIIHTIPLPWPVVRTYFISVSKHNSHVENERVYSYKLKTFLSRSSKYVLIVKKFYSFCLCKVSKNRLGVCCCVAVWLSVNLLKINVDL